jgi:hypothetical protein
MASSREVASEAQVFSSELRSASGPMSDRRIPCRASSQGERVITANEDVATLRFKFDLLARQAARATTIGTWMARYLPDCATGTKIPDARGGRRSRSISALMRPLRAVPRPSRSNPFSPWLGR